MNHYYTPDGVLVEGAGLKEARKQNLYVSPTTIIHEVWANTGLDYWKEGELIKAVLCTPQFPDEPMYQYVGRVRAKANRIKDKAAEFGTAVHDAAEHYGSGAYVDQFIQPYLDTYIVWFEGNVKRVIAREIVVVDHDIGVAGKIDIVRENFSDEVCIDDLKTQTVKEGNKAGDRQGFLEQIAFYAKAYQKMNGLPDAPRCQNLLINSTEVSPVVQLPWSPNQVEEGYQAFRALAWIYFRSRGVDGYWPVGKWEL